MKKLFYAIVAFAAAVIMAGCTKDGAGVTASIVGTWEITSMATEISDANGNVVSTADFIAAMLKAQGATDAYIQEHKAEIERMANEMFATASDITPTRTIFSADGKVSASSKDKDGKWSDPQPNGTYKLDGNTLTITNADKDTITFTVVTLNSTTLIINQDATSTLEGEAAAMFKQLNYKMAAKVSFKRV